MQNIKNKNHSLPLTSQSVLQETETETDRRNLLASEVLEKVCTPTKNSFSNPEIGTIRITQKVYFCLSFSQFDSFLTLMGS